LLQARERELRLGLDPGRPQHLEVVRAIDRGPQELALADSRRTRHQQRGAATGSRAIQPLAHLGELGVAAEHRHLVRA
jgi:hypothetical protein